MKAEHAALSKEAKQTTAKIIGASLVMILLLVLIALAMKHEPWLAVAIVPIVGLLSVLGNIWYRRRIKLRAQMALLERLLKGERDEERTENRPRCEVE